MADWDKLQLSPSSSSLDSTSSNICCVRSILSQGGEGVEAEVKPISVQIVTTSCVFIPPCLLLLSIDRGGLIPRGGLGFWEGCLGSEWVSITLKLLFPPSSWIWATAHTQDTYMHASDHVTGDGCLHYEVFIDSLLKTWCRMAVTHSSDKHVCSSWQSRWAPRAAPNPDTLLVPSKLNPAVPPKKPQKLSWRFFFFFLFFCSTAPSSLYLSGEFPAVWPNHFKLPWGTFQSKVSQSSKRNQRKFFRCHRRNSDFQDDHVFMWFIRFDEWDVVQMSVILGI